VSGRTELVPARRQRGPRVDVWHRLTASWVPVATLTAIGAAVRFTGLGQSFWIDEVITVRLVSGPLVDMLRSLPDAESTPPLYYVLAWIWARVAGADEVGLRSLSALFGTLTIPVCYAAARTLLSHRVGVIVAALAAVSPLLVWYSQEARAYGLFALLGALSFLFFAQALAEASPRRLALWAGASSLMLLTHYFGIFLVTAEGSILLYRHRSRAVWAATGAIVGVGLALLPLAAYQAIYSSSRWIRFVDLHARIEEAVQQLLVPGAPSMWAGAGVAETDSRSLWPLGIVVLVCAVATIALLGSRNERRRALVALGVGLATVGLPVLMSLAAGLVAGGRGDVFLFRNVIVAWLPLAVVVGAALGAQRAGRTGVLVATALTILSFAVVVQNATTPDRQRDDWRLVSRALGTPTGQIVLLSPSWQIAALQYHVPDLRELADREVATRQIDLLVRRNVPSYSPAVERLRLPPEFTRVDTQELQNWILTRFRSQSPVYVSGSDLGVAPAEASRIPLVRTR
jgi:mannosyltransferase